MIRLYVIDADDALRRTLAPGPPWPDALGGWELLSRVRLRLGAIRWRPEGPWLGVASDRGPADLVAADVHHARLRAAATVATGGHARIEVASCPHSAEVGCGCRRPAPGLLLELMARFDVRPDETLFAGDPGADAEAARRAGVAFALATDFFSMPARSTRCGRPVPRFRPRAGSDRRRPR